jgi:hypothetical protein
MGNKRGQPQTSLFVKRSIAYKVLQYSKRYNESNYKGWLRLTKHRAFESLMKEHFKNKSGSAAWWIKNIKREDVKKNFYKNHIKKFIIDYRLTKGIGSL